MTLLERMAARLCAVRECKEDRAPDSDVCAPHLTDKWMHRLVRESDGTYTLGRFVARDESGWLRAA